jgi:hypothetical protein
LSLAEAFRQQAGSCARLGSPFMGQLLGLLAERWTGPDALHRFFESFSGDLGPAGHSLPLRLAGGLHALVLSGRAPDLAALYPPHATGDDALWAAVENALRAHEAFLLDWVRSPPQTNEVRRAAALMAGAAELAARCDLPVVLSELGASGGLNLAWDRFALKVAGHKLGPDDAALTLSPEWRGPAPRGHLLRIAAAAGVDLNPLDPSDPHDLLRLKAYLWPDQPHRLALTEAAARVQRAPVARGDAIDWLETRLAEAHPGHLHLIQHTVAWQYFPAAAQARGKAMIEAAGARATADAPLAWLAMESDGDSTGTLGARLDLRLWPGDLHLLLGRVDFHGRWINWNPQPEE